MTARVAAFLRAINVGGRRVTNDELVEIAGAAGFDDVDAYQAAGNLVVTTDDPSTVADVLESALAQRLGYDSEVFVRTGGQLGRVLAVNPFDDADVARARSKPQVGFLRAPVAADVVEEVLALQTDTDLLAVDGCELHWLPIAGQGRSPLDTGALDGLIGPMTIRGVGTLQRMHDKYFG